MRDRAVDPPHNSLGPLHSGANQRLRAWTRPAILQIFRRFQMTRDEDPGDDS
jgi:hypothetical protein